MSENGWVTAIEQYLAAEGRSWAWLAVQVRVPETTLSKARHGTRRLKRPVQRRIARILGQSTLALFGPEEA